jgi:hypothetical protein
MDVFQQHNVQFGAAVRSLLWPYIRTFWRHRHRLSNMSQVLRHITKCWRWAELRIAQHGRRATHEYFDVRQRVLFRPIKPLRTMEYVVIQIADMAPMTHVIVRYSLCRLTHQNPQPTQHHSIQYWWATLDDINTKTEITECRFLLLFF